MKNSSTFWFSHHLWKEGELKLINFRIQKVYLQISKLITLEINQYFSIYLWNFYVKLITKLYGGDYMLLYFFIEKLLINDFL